MNTKFCFVYPWATFGGCERVFINRAIAFKTYLPGVHVDFYFLSDGGGLKNFSAALEKYDLTGTASIVSSLDRAYDMISLVDCPQLFSELNFSKQQIIVECHSGYSENRRYLSNLPPDCRVVVTPSARFSDLIRSEFSLPFAEVSELANFVPWDTEAYVAHKDIALPNWSRIPVLFFGRMDKLKNPVAILDAIKIIEGRRPGTLMLVFCGPKSDEIHIDSEITKRGLNGLVVTLPPIPFHMAPALMESIRRVGGIFVSPSREESFGLSAAEAISSLLPPALSSVGAHLDLLGEASHLFTFDIWNAHSLADRVEYLIDHHSNTQRVLQDLRAGFSAKRFIVDWHALMNSF